MVAECTQGAEKESQIYGQMIAEVAKEHSSEAFCALGDPLGAMVFSVMAK